MHPQPQQMPVDVSQTEVEAIAAVYRRAHRGDDRAALLAVITDALVDLDAAGRLAEVRTLQVSCGYVRAALTKR